jgi:ATP synthase protein I
MPSDNKPENSDSRKPVLQEVQTTSTQLTMAMEVPFTFVGAVVVGGLIGYFLDKWLHTDPWLLILFGCFGFVAGIREIARRFGPKSSGSNNDKPAT